MLENFGNGWGALAGLEDGSAAGCDCSNERRNGQIYREIVGSAPSCQHCRGSDSNCVPYDQHSSQRILSDAWAQQLVHQWNVWCCLVLDPFREVLGDEDDIILAPFDLAKMSLESRFPQIFLAGLDYCSFVVY